MPHPHGRAKCQRLRQLHLARLKWHRLALRFSLFLFLLLAVSLPQQRERATLCLVRLLSLQRAGERCVLELLADVACDVVEDAERFEAIPVESKEMDAVLETYCGKTMQGMRVEVSRFTADVMVCGL